MDFETFAQSVQKEECSDSSEDSSFESLPDNESFTQIDSDDEYVPNNRIASSTQSKSTRKRMQTFDEHNVVKRRKTSSTSTGTHNRIERMPTRQPDPNVQNRNALMARENRRRKKEHVKVLEAQLEQKALEIRSLRKILKQKDQTVKKLEHEALYLRSTIANKTDIMTLLKTIRGNKLPLTSSTLSFVTDDDDRNDRRLNGSVASRSPATSSTASFAEDEKENDYDLGFGQSTIGDSLAMGDWRSLLNDDDDDNVASATEPKYNLSTPASDTMSLVNSEHNYYQHTNWESETDERCAKGAGPGICLHLSGGRVSLEFCAACHSSSQNAWIEEM